MDGDLSQRLVDLARELQGEEHLASTAETVTREVVEWVGADAASGISMVRRRGRVEKQVPPHAFPVNPDPLDCLTIETTTEGDIAWVILQGEADVATLEQLDTALQRLELEGSRLVCIHATALNFADAATVDRLADFARKATRAGLDVKTVDASPVLRTVAHLLGVEDALGLA